MPYGEIKVDNITFTNVGADQATTVSGIYRAITSGVTVTGTISGATIQGATVSGTAGIFGAGSAGAPSISFTSDPNTGIYSPAADTLAFAEGGVEALRIDSSGRVGIGTTSPGTTLEISAGGGSSPSLIGTGGNFAVTQPGLLTSLEVGGYASAPYGLWLQGKNKTGQAFPIILNPVGGNVGIGTTSPSELLNLSGDSNPSIQLTATNDTTPIINWRSLGTDRLRLFSSSAVGACLDVRSNQHIQFNTNSTERARIDFSGNVGIGTSLPSARLQVDAPTSSRSYSSSIFNFSNIHLDGITSNSTTSALTFASGGGGGAAVAFGRGIEYDTQISFWTNSAATANTATQQMVLSSAGRLGIGTTSPANQSTTQVTSDNDGIRVQFSGTPIGGQGPRLIFGHNTNNGTQQIFAAIKSLMQGGNDVTWSSDLAFYTGGSSLAERLRINSSGNVGIGTSSPSYSLHVTGSGNSSGTLCLSPSGTGGSPSYVILGNSDSGGASGPNVIQSANRSLAFGVGTSFTAGGGGTFTEYARIDYSGNVGIGTSSPAAKLHVETIPQAINQSGSVLFGPNTDYGFELRNVINSVGFPRVELRAPVAGTGPMYFYAAGAKVFFDGGTTELMRIDYSGNVGIGTSSPGSILTVSDPGTGLQFTNAASGNYNIGLLAGTGSADAYVFNRANSALIFGTNNTERLRIDSSGRLLVGTSTALLLGSSLSTYALNIETLVGGGVLNHAIGATRHGGATPEAGQVFTLARSRGTTLGAVTLVANNDTLGVLEFCGADGTDFGTTAAVIKCEVDGTPGANDMPGRLVFSTTADGAASPTERFRISSDGSFSSVIPGGSTLYPRFGCRAWVNFNGTGTVAIRGSGNVSSITDNGVGDYTVNFTTAMPDANYAAVSESNAVGVGGSSYQSLLSFFSQTASSVRFTSVGDYPSGGNNDKDNVSVVIFR